jgi:putative transposase
MREGRDRSNLIRHGDRGVRHRAIRYAEQLAEAGVNASVGFKGESYDNALAEVVSSIFEAELIRSPIVARHPGPRDCDGRVHRLVHPPTAPRRTRHGPPVDYEHDHHRHHPASTTVEAVLLSLH